MVKQQQILNEIVIRTIDSYSDRLVYKCKCCGKQLFQEFLMWLHIKNRHPELKKHIPRYNIMKAAREPYLDCKNSWQNMVFKKTSTDGIDSSINKFRYGVRIRPRYSKRDSGGEDAACLTDRILCVADGVSSWSKRKVDPAVYSKNLCKTIYELSMKYDGKYLYSPEDLLAEAVR